LVGEVCGRGKGARTSLHAKVCRNEELANREGEADVRPRLTRTAMTKFIVVVVGITPGRIMGTN